MEKNTNIEKPIATDAQNNLNVVVRYISYLNPLKFRQRGTRAKALFALSLVSFFWGTTWIASRQAVLETPALQTAGIRQFLGGLCYVVFFMVRRTPFPKGKEWNQILVLTFLNFVLSNALSTWGVKYISAGLGAIIGAIFPLWLVIIGLVAHKTRPKSKTLAGLLLGFGGICVIFFEHLGHFFDPEFRLGIFLSLASTWSWAFGTIYTKKHAAHFNPYFGLGLQMVISGTFLFGFSHATNNAIPLDQIPVDAWTAILYLVVFGSVIAFVAYLYALQNLPTEQASLYAYINPIVAVTFGALIFGEKLTIFILVGTLITLTGVYLVNHSAAKTIPNEKK